MPRTQIYQPVSLKDASLQNIACHFESYWCAGKTTSVNYRRLQKCIEPFEYFNDAMTQKILDSLAEKNHLEIHHFQFLLSSNIRRLNLNMLEQLATHDSIIQTVGVRCRKLTHLNLSGLRTNSGVLCSIFNNLPELVSLNLSNTNTDHTVLRSVAKSCPNLLELNFEKGWLTPCPNYDIQEFVKISKKLGYPKLKRLDCSMTRILVNTVAALLHNQRALETLDSLGDIHKAFDLMYGKPFQQTKEIPPEWIVPLLKLRIVYTDECPNGSLSENTCLELTFRCCPYVTDLCLFYLNDYTSFSHVSKLRHLNRLKLRGTEDVPINFPRYLLPVFKKLGKKLKFLSLRFVSDLSLITIGTLCPHLEKLRTNHVYAKSERYDFIENPVVCFKHLVDLRVINYRRSLSEGVLSAILVNSSQLREMMFIWCNITDDIISKAIQIHGFKHLHRALFRGCELISSNTGMMLLCTDSPLEKLGFCTCEKIKQDESDQLIQEVSRFGYNVKVIYCESCDD